MRSWMTFKFELLQLLEVSLSWSSHRILNIISIGEKGQLDIEILTADLERNFIGMIQVEALQYSITVFSALAFKTEFFPVNGAAVLLVLQVGCIGYDHKAKKRKDDFHLDKVEILVFVSLSYTKSSVV